jgi:hypothetical protein
MRWDVIRMRKALNENPVVQAAVIGVLILIAGIWFVTKGKKDDGGSTAATPATSTTSASVTGPGGTVDVTAEVTPSASAPSAATSAPSTGGSVTPEALVPGPGLPAEVIRAWSRRGQAVVLLIVRPRGIDDRLVRDASRVLNADPNVKLIVVPANKIARYSRITQGVGVDRVPALVVVRPRRGKASVPQAQVSYGFRTAQSVVQAVQDAVYKGRDDLPYYPG